MEILHFGHFLVELARLQSLFLPKAATAGKVYKLGRRYFTLQGYSLCIDPEINIHIEFNFGSFNARSKTI